MNILFIGDIVGQIGRKTALKLVPELRRKYDISLVIANAENATHGSGLSEESVKELLGAKIDVLTSGDHALRRYKQAFIFEKYPVLRPANFPPQTPGLDYLSVKAGQKKIIIINLIGRIFMPFQYDCPFRKIDEILAHISLQEKNIFAIITDIHAEASSEKKCLAHYLDGRVSAIVGTHTHVQTNDAQISPLKTGYLTDVGMTGALNSSLGIGWDGVIKSYLDQIKYPHAVPETGEAELNAVLISLDKNGKTSKLKPLKAACTIN